MNGTFVKQRVFLTLFFTFKKKVLIMPPNGILGFIFKWIT